MPIKNVVHRIIILQVDQVATLCYVKNKRVTVMHNRKRLARTVLIFTESSDQLSRVTDRVPGLPASPGYAQ